MPEYIKIKAIEELKDQLEFGRGITTAEPPIISAQAEYLVALSAGLSLDNLRVHRILPLALFMSDYSSGMSDDPEVVLFQRIAEVIINDLVPALDADFISSPFAEAGSIGWRPTIRTKRRYTTNQLTNWQHQVKLDCHEAVMLVAERDALVQEMAARNPLLRDLEEATQRLCQAEQELRSAAGHGTKQDIQRAKRPYLDAKAHLEERKAEYEMMKAQYESDTARYESRSALVEAFTKLMQLLIKTAGACAIIVGSLHIFVPSGNQGNPSKIQVSTKSSAQSHASWAGVISEVLEKLGEEIGSESK
jgi:hypothetical protein